MSLPTNYSAARASVDGIDIVRLADNRHNTEVSIVPSVGNNAFEMKVNEINIFWSPYQSVAQYKAHPVHLGNPFLAPWANRLDGDAFWANGKKYLLNPGLNNIHRDGNHLPMHGLLQFSSHWEVVAMEATQFGAWTTSRLEFWRYPDYIAQFPFAHDIEMSHRLEDGVLESRADHYKSLGRSPCRCRSRFILTSGSPMPPATTGMCTFRCANEWCWMRI